jgi:hypothetical protein
MLIPACLWKSIFRWKVGQLSKLRIPRKARCCAPGRSGEEPRQPPAARRTESRAVRFQGSYDRIMRPSVYCPVRRIRNFEIACC